MSATTQTPEVVACPSCGAKNRVSPDQRRHAGKVVCGRCKTPLGTVDSPTHPIVVTDATFAAEVEHSPLPVLLDMWAPWCGPCRTIAPIIEQLARELAGRVKVAKLNVDENPKTAARYGVQSIPTLLILNRGDLVDTLVGAQPKQAILTRLARV